MRMRCVSSGVARRDSVDGKGCTLTDPGLRAQGPGLAPCRERSDPAGPAVGIERAPETFFQVFNEVPAHEAGRARYGVARARSLSVSGSSRLANSLPEITSASSS